MIRIGIVGGAKSYHGLSFCQIFNGYNRQEALKKGWKALYEERLKKEARITHIWDENRKDAQEVAQICSIEKVVEKKEDMIGEIDGVIITDDGTMKHQKRAIPFLKEGIPTFIDKPLSPDIREAEEIIELAKKCKASLMSCSALRYAKETEILREGKEKLGEILTGLSICREWQGSLIFYGIHALELLYSIIGGGIKSVRNVGEEREDLLILTYKDGRRFIVSSYEAISPLYQINLYGTQGYRSILIQDYGYFYTRMLEEFVTMVETKIEPFPPEETLEIIRVLVMGENSRKEGKAKEIPLI